MTAPARDAILALLARRAPDATACPSEVARAITADADWRRAMPAVHAAVDALVQEGAVRLSWKGRALAVRDGPYRIAGAHVDRDASAARHETRVASDAN